MLCVHFQVNSISITRAIWCLPGIYIKWIPRGRSKFSSLATDFPTTFSICRLSCLFLAKYCHFPVTRWCWRWLEHKVGHKDSVWQHRGWDVVLQTKSFDKKIENVCLKVQSEHVKGTLCFPFCFNHCKRILATELWLTEFEVAEAISLKRW